MALTYAQSAALTTDLDFRGRVKVACLKYAGSIIDEQPNVTAHNTRYKWAQNTFANPDMVAAQVQPPTVMDSAVQGSGAAITDAGLQGAVETVVNKMI
jgi:hypothetical protein